ncbi:GGDEF domain-containing protein [Sphingopyxis sp. BSN-002]|uniref:GGDEF domain-containing protein n=1 Tax=Sphingopyxis sp. BSN-002 TaxID=2911495 RepID=UPI001EDB00AA|nr:GGDEF domain-containing protein [Sphingopyxis sp. BSN-002]UKK83075.1 GGDEF domain-containing protein [Sphingopyxis sp. BSN-002]
MNYYNVIGILNTSMAAIFCIALLAIWRNNRTLNYIRVFGLSYAVRSLCFGIFYFAFSLENPVLRYSANIFLLFAIVLLAIGLSHRRGRPPRYGALLAIGALTLGPLNYYQFVDPNLFARVIILNSGLALLSLLMLLDVARTTRRTPVEQVLLGLLLVSCAGYLLRPLFLIASGASGQQFEGSYWLVVSISDALICAMTAVGIFAVIASDVMDSIKSDALTDALSGLFNRRGFEPRALWAMEMQADGRPVALILGDLDHFKSINDQFGHTSGDLIIRRFSEVLKDKAPGGAILARLGGEEFAIMLPSGAAVAAHELAEEIRTAFKQTAPDIMSGEASPTASFGIAIAREDENLEALMDRADRALYRAKGDGRDRVHLAE